ncbi:MAG TPA: 2-C-methyl-D-erythritol 4-phosphate cytidylyltransferase [Pontiellaceae bacterium]|nr:2-C-methyl-D-erythritol 4-phosphate cytidylyltransferase [Pontiellaceae bacterium]HPR83039.1 2-C-methyl-D-erythritol 4-phosphate cytidylyltransferase [Pontiellaceae bacterium]
MSAWAIVLACGKDQEIGAGVDVAFLALGSRPVVARSIQTLEQNPLIEGIILVVRKERVDSAMHTVRSFGCRKISAIVAGGPARLTNLKNALERVPDDATAVLIHEATRPFLNDEIITETVKAGKRYGAAVAAVKSADAVKLAEKGQKVTRSLDRNSVWLVQSPQVYKIDVFKKMIKGSGKLIDDDSELLAKGKQEIHLVAGSPGNMKIRTPDDLQIASAILSVARRTP